MARRSQIPVDGRGIPEKPFFKIGEAAAICALEPYVLRYWETEFRSIRPQKTRSGQRLYRKQDVETLLRIRELLHDKGFTIKGARAFLREAGHPEDAAAPVPPPAIDRKNLNELKHGLQELLALVED